MSASQPAKSRQPVPSSRPRGRARTRRRLAPDARRRQILAAAGRVLTQHGVEKVRVLDIADLAGISRPVVYRFFPTRRELVLAILEDFEQELNARFREALVHSVPGSLPQITQAFVEACCDAIEAKGSGPWYLLDARGATDPEVARLGLGIHERLLAPWHPRIAETTGLDADRVQSLVRIVVAAGRAALDGWIEHRRSRPEAVQDATRAISVLLREFATRETETGRQASRARGRSRLG